MQKRISFGGMNRAVTDYDNAGALEECINLRPDGRGGFRPARGKKNLEALNGYTFRCVHGWAGGRNRIYMNAAGYVYYTNDTTTKQMVGSYSAEDVCTVGDMLVLSNSSVGMLRVFKVSNTDGSYTEQSVAPPVLDVEIEGSDTEFLSESVQIHDSSYWIGLAEPSEKMLALIEDRMGILHAKNSDRCFGLTLVALQYRLRDGRAWFTDRIIPFIAAGGGSSTYYATVEFTALPDGTLTVQDYGSKLSVTVHALSWGSEFVEAVDIYCTKPVERRGGFRQTSGGISVGNIGFQYNMKGSEALMAEQGLFHRVASVTREQALAGVSVPLSFGDELEASPVMDVDQGCVMHTGNLVSYNGRVHVYGGQNNIHGCCATGVKLSQAMGTVTTAYAKMDVPGGPLVMKTPAEVPTGYGIVIYPDARCTALLVGTSGSSGVKMKASGKYNFAWGEVGSTTSVVQNQRTFVTYPERSAVNVSRQMLPFAFDAANSYAIPAAVKDIVPSVVPISEYQAGQYPLHLFTDTGIFALEQGNGDVLYRAVTPVSEYTADSNVVSTPYGKLFLSRGGLYLRVGTHTEKLSGAMEGGPHQEVYADSAQTSYMGGTTYFSSVTFEEFCDGGTVAFDPLHMEVIVSNPGKTYSYVFSFATKMWHKVTGTYKGTDVMDLAVSGSWLMDMKTDAEQDTAYVWLLSRPFAPEEMRYTHIDRLVQEFRTFLPYVGTTSGVPQWATVRMCLMASNDLIHWRCVSASVKNGGAMLEAIGQIRPEKPHRSWKWYALSVSGQVPAMRTAIQGEQMSEAHIGGLMVDYHISRRNMG